MPIQALKLRLKSILTNGKIYPISPEWMIRQTNAVAFTGGTFPFTAPRPCKLVRVDYVADVNGAGASVIALNKHVAGQTAAANAALSGTNIVRLVTNDIPADSTVRVPVLNRPLVTTAGVTVFAAGDKLAMVTPATWVGTVTCWFAWV
jgi:hypothetical protein